MANPPAGAAVGKRKGAQEGAEPLGGVYGAPRDWGGPGLLLVTPGYGTQAIWTR